MLNPFGTRAGKATLGAFAHGIRRELLDRCACSSVLGHEPETDCQDGDACGEFHGVPVSCGVGRIDGEWYRKSTAEFQCIRWRSGFQAFRCPWRC